MDNIANAQNAFENAGNYMAVQATPWLLEAIYWQNCEIIALLSRPTGEDDV